ncbi:hypothetical protein [Lampropedia aestuarii]|uniref:hypothetical protein n=1 Tax=Lampropedia aestuarii TaxID=2562762 RepID=UPI002468A355|nr:hypothetical protein [Lampropedia aestuarii]MDH5859176.1 hypothetical protein [Lampropedia aestuarii]
MDPRVLEINETSTELDYDMHNAVSLNSVDRDSYRYGQSCGCFQCLHQFKSQAIKQWIDGTGKTPNVYTSRSPKKRTKSGDMPLCPSCGFDTVLYVSKDQEVSQRELQQLHDYWFSPERAYTMDLQGRHRAYLDHIHAHASRMHVLVQEQLALPYEPKPTQTRDILRNAARHSSRNMREILHSQRCGCYYCLRRFKPSKIEDWSDEGPDKESQNAQHQLYTAWCPYCGIDAVIGSAAGYPLTTEFLTKMRKRSFGI